MSSSGKSRILGLDYLRAAAILMVLVAHTLPGRGHTFISEYTSGLFAVMGVELFFVLSGFLIGGILIREVKSASNGLSTTVLINFWKRRWLRTLPACYVFLFLHMALEKWLSPTFDPAFCVGVAGLGAIGFYFWQHYYAVGHTIFDRVFLLSLIPIAWSMLLPICSGIQRDPGARSPTLASAMTFLSLISYSLYLCHTPCIRAVNQLWQEFIGPLTSLNRIPIIFIDWVCFISVAYLSYRFVETPFFACGTGR